MHIQSNGLSLSSNLVQPWCPDDHLLKQKNLTAWKAAMMLECWHRCSGGITHQKLISGAVASSCIFCSAECHRFGARPRTKSSMPSSRGSWISSQTPGLIYLLAPRTASRKCCSMYVLCLLEQTWWTVADLQLCWHVLVFTAKAGRFLLLQCTT